MKALVQLGVQLVKTRKEIRYIISGGLSEVVELLSFAALLAVLPQWLYAANSLSFILGVLTGFVLHKLWSFPGEHRFQTQHQFVGYVSLAIFNFFMINVLVGYFVYQLELLPIVAKFLSITICLSWTYILTTKVIFRHAQPATKPPTDQE